MEDTYYAMCVDGIDLQTAKSFYHCVAIAKSKEQAIEKIKSNRNLHILSCNEINHLFNSNGYMPDVAELAQQVNYAKPVVFSKSIAFFKKAEEEQKESALNFKEISYENNDDFFNTAKEHMIKELEQGAFLMLDLSSFNSIYVFEEFTYRMHRIFFGAFSISAKHVAPYLFEPKDGIKFLQQLD